MTARTHDLGALTAIILCLAYFPLPPLSLATAVTAFFANMFGGLFPDLDETTAEFWRKLRGGSLLAKLVSPLLGGHRLLSHSLIGLVVFGYLAERFFLSIRYLLLVDMHLVWLAFMLGYISHLCLDALTSEGIPLLFPLGFNFGFPPLKLLRLKTGSLVEKALVFPALVGLNFYLFYAFPDRFLTVIRNLLSTQL